MVQEILDELNMSHQITRGLRHASIVNSNGLATFYRGQVKSWGNFYTRVTKLAGAMQASGLDVGGRVLLLASNSDKFLEVLYATLWAGGVIVPINTRLSRFELSGWIDDSSAKLLFVSEDFEKLGVDASMDSNFKGVLVGLDRTLESNSIKAYEEILKSGLPVNDACRSGSDLAAICYTGGTTGKSKGVMLSHENLVCNCLNVSSSLHLDSSAKYLHASPMFHALAVAGVYGTTMYAGSHYFIDKFDVDKFSTAIEEYSITHTALVPTMINMTASFAIEKGLSMPSLKFLFYGGSSMPERAAYDAVKVFPNAQLLQGYGLTESSPTITLLTHVDHFQKGDKSKRLRSSGQPVPGIDILIQDKDGDELPRGKCGEICARGPTITSGYWNLPHVTDSTIKNGWLHTGDVGYIDDDGFVFIVDRLKDMIISGGENIYSSEIENILYLHPAVYQCAVIGLPNEKWGQVVHAIISVKDNINLTTDDLVKHCLEYLPSFKIPKTFDIRTETLPMSGAGKILKSELISALSPKV